MRLQMRVAPTLRTGYPPCDTFYVSGESRLESAACEIVAAARIGDSKLLRASGEPPLGGFCLLRQ